MGAMIEKVGFFNTELRTAEDLDLWWRIAYRWPRIGYVSRALVVYHLNVSGSLTQEPRPLSVFGDLVARHIDLAKEQGRLKEFEPFAAGQLRKWMRGALFDKRGVTVRATLKRFSAMQPFGYKVVMYILTIRPELTRGVCRMLSRVVRFLRLRRGAVRAPRK